MTAPSDYPVLVLSPHPDDESLGCGGTIKLLTQAGVPVDVLYLTRGERGTTFPEMTSQDTQRLLAQVRSEEARTACACLGVRDVFFLDGRDGFLAEQQHLSEALAERLCQGRYQRVFCPWQCEKHADHVAAFMLLRRALCRCPLPQQVWLYEVWTPLTPTVYVPIDATMAVKLTAVRAHQSQLACLDYLSAFQGLAAYRSLGCPGSRYAEAFVVADRQSIVDGQFH